MQHGIGSTVEGTRGDEELMLGANALLAEKVPRGAPPLIRGTEGVPPRRLLEG